MSLGQSTDRLFAMPAFEGLRVLRQYKAAHPEIGIDEIIGVIERVEPDGRNLDLEASIYLDAMVEDSCSLEGQSFYRTCIKAIVLNRQPIWAKSMSQGRIRFISKLETNDKSIFYAAAALEIKYIMYEKI